MVVVVDDELLEAGMANSEVAAGRMPGTVGYKVGNWTVVADIRVAVKVPEGALVLFGRTLSSLKTP